jgi:puromycin-sensitive aminopeptidase
MAQRSDPFDLAGLDPYRLPTDALPTRYDVRLRPDLRAGAFSGTVTIRLDLLGPVERLVLNSAELTIERCEVDGIEVDWRLDDDHERLVVVPAEPLTDATATLAVEFAGILNDKLRGFYRSTYVDEAGEQQVIATSQMQATDCRRAFPCWDEPEFKAVFGVTLDVESGLTAISNGAELERSDADGRTLIRFADTMAMSTYLVAFVVGRLEATDPVDVDGTPIRIVHVPGKRELTGFGLDVAAFCLGWFQDYYGIPYPADKVDLVALPDFAAGAMENLGCITFRESLLLVDPTTGTQHERQNVADVVAHELAHMWFGDLVTMRWWNGIWLNEAFATFMEVAACDAYRPDWERWTSFGLERSVALDTDSLATTRPVEYEVRSPADCEGMFDVLTYEKGGALLRMLEQYLGADRFRDGVGHYLRTHAHSNTETNDLWDAIEATSGDPVRRIMDSWIWQPGYPMVTARLADDGRHVVLGQRRFRFAAGDGVDGDETDGDAVDGDGEGATWVVPIHLRSGSTATTVLLEDATPLTLPLAEPGAPLVVNAGGHGFFRVSYDSALRSRLDAGALAGMSTLERYDLVDDAWASTIAGDLAAVELLRLLEGFVGERDHAVWQAVLGALRGLARLVDGDALAALRIRIADLVRPALQSLGDPDDREPDLRGKLRGSLTAALGVLGDDPAVQARCRDLLAAAHADPASVHPELVSAATSVVAAGGGPNEYEEMLAAMRRASTPQDQLRHLWALAEFDDAALVERTLGLAMSAEVKSQNAPFLLRAAIANRHHGRLAWEFVKDHWNEANERFPDNTIVRMIDSVKLLNRPDDVADVAAFFTDRPIEQAATTQRQILERQRVNAALRSREEGPFGEHLLA